MGLISNQRGSSTSAKTLKKYREDLQMESQFIRRSASGVKDTWSGNVKGQVSKYPLATMMSANDRNLKNMYKDSMIRKMDVDVLDAKTLDFINTLSVQEMSSMLGKEAHEDIEMAASKRAQTSHWDDQSEDMFQEINTQSQMWMKMMGVRHYMHYTSRTRSAELEMEEYQQAQANRDKGAVDDMVVDYEFASASLARFRRSGWKDPCPSGAFMRPSTESCFPVNESQLRKVPDELHAFRKRMYDLGGGFHLAEGSQVETTSALRKWFHNVQRRQKEQTWEKIGSVGAMPSVVLTPEQMLEKRMFETNMSRGEDNGAAAMRLSGRGSPGGNKSKQNAALGSMGACQMQSLGPGSAMSGEVAGARGGVSVHDSVGLHAQKSFVTSEASGRVSREGSVVYIEESKDGFDDAVVPPAKQDGYLRTWALGLSSRPERPKTAPAGGRRTRTLFGVPVANEEGSGLISPDFRPAPSSGAMSSMSTARATPRNQAERVSPWMRASDDGNDNVNSGDGNNTKGSPAAVSFLLGSTPASPGKRPSTAPARRQQANNVTVGRGVLSGALKRPSSARGPRDVTVSPPLGESWAITQASSPIPPSPPRHSRQVAFSPRPSTLAASPSKAASPISPRGQSRLAAVVSPRGGRSIGEGVPRVANPENRELDGGFGYIAPHSGWASAHAASPRPREAAKGWTPAKPASPYSHKQGRPMSARTLSSSNRPAGGQSRVRPSSAKSPGGKRD